MEPGGISLLASGIWIIPLAIVAVMAAAFAWVELLQRETHKELLPILTIIQKYQSELRALIADAQAYSRDDEEPFGSKAGILETEVANFQARIESILREYVSLQAIRRRNKYRTWQMALGSIFFWYDWFRLRSDAKALRESVDLLEPPLQRLKTRHRELQRIGWTVAQRIRGVVRRMDGVNALLAHLSDQRFYGDSFDAMVQETSTLQDELNEIDPDFLTQDEEHILSNVDKGAVAATYAYIDSAEPRLEDLTTQLTSLKRAYNGLETEVGAMTSSLREVRNTLEDVPENLDVDESQERLRSLETIAETIRSTMKRIEIESLDEIFHQAQAVRTNSEDLQSLLRSASNDLASLQNILNRLHERQVLLLEQIETLAEKQRHPVDWGSSLERARAINAVLEMLGPLDKPRVPDQVASQMNTAAEVLPEQSDLLHHCSQITADRSDLLSAIDDIQAIDLLQWLEDASGLAARAARYAPENWPEPDGVARLSEDIETIDSRVRDLAMPDEAQAIPEAEIPGKKESYEALRTDIQSMQHRLERVKTRLGELKTQEENVREQLDLAWLTVSQLEGLASGNQYLEKITGRQLEKFHKRLEDMRDEFQTVARGRMERRLSEVESLVSELSNAAGEWFSRLYAEVEAIKDELASKLELIDSMADLDEPEIERVEKILNEDARASVSSQPPTQLSLEEIIPNMKRRSDVWQQGNITLKLIEEKIEAPLNAAYSQTSGLRKQVRSLLTQADRLISRERTWPPSSLEIHSEHTEFEQLELAWDQLPEQPGAVIWVVRRYDELSGGYRSLADRLRQMLKWAESEHDRVQSFESQIDRDLKAWRDLERKYSGERMVTSRIRKLREDALTQRDRIYRRWRLSVEDTPRQPAYEQALEALQTLARELNTAVVRVGSESDGLDTIQLNTSMGEFRSADE
jgi:chromosome segregation ATPase